MTSDTLDNRQAIEAAVVRVLNDQPVIDMHTHLYPPSFGTPVRSSAASADPKGLMLWGIDELLTYHYLIAELFRVVTPAELTPERYYAMSRQDQAETIWKHLFIERSPVSEACRGVLTTLQKLGLDTYHRNLDGFRTYFAEQDPNKYVDRVMALSKVESITMTNDVFDDNERQRWLDDPSIGEDPRFTAVLRFDQLIVDWPHAAGRMRDWGYDVADEPDDKTLAEVRRFLGEWFERTRSIYAAVSLPPTWRFPASCHGHGDTAARAKAGHDVLTGAILPACADANLPFAMMIGVKRGVNPALGGAGDMGFKSDIESVGRLCAEFPNNRFFVTMLARENQHELAVMARKFGNLMVFGCWWFLNNPTLIDEMTRMRMELLGTSFIPQHSDARVLDQLLYKWSHSRRILRNVLIDKYSDLVDTGWGLRVDDIKRDVRLLLHDNFTNFLKG
ncbi:MAG: glucuronate isomerase [Phycisphaera sp.]|nr:glucuronate isomerase [Phycisphaera sp.]